MWNELRRQPRRVLVLMLASTGFTFTSLLMRGPNPAFGGPAVYLVVLGGSGAILILSVVLILLQRRDRRR